ncbi:hypothetical protein [Asticcacaulis sp. AND118]|uniref:hypothetical protein n=1 Tax=Asticcacaulis sp. AND118 TaxID=2840468 RepID=UPI001CFFD83C|nr:hypothetical protein [Asticcacaulis sp. AND118]UDF05239.1 hypothetical protein LH365_17790 [Asticcacaulis sp. AND118]
MKQTQKPLSFDDVTFPPHFETEAPEDVLAWQTEKVKAGRTAADECRFATPDEISAIVQKFVPNA